MGDLDFSYRNLVCARLTGTQLEIKVKRAIYNDPATIVYWTDGTKTVVKCQPGDTYSPLMGFLMAALKKSCGNKGNYNEMLKKWVPGYGGGDNDSDT